jgi:large subunit ribosomal protein L19e
VTNLSNQRRLAADILKCGVNRVHIDPLYVEDVGQAVTRDDIRELIDDGIISKRRKEGQSRGRARELQEQKQKGRHQGPGSRKGASGGRESEKDQWKKRIRALRRTLKTLRDEGHVDSSTYRTYYDQAKGGEFRSKQHLIDRMHTEGALDASVSLETIDLEED